MNDSIWLALGTLVWLGSQEKKPSLKVAADGFPAGSSTAEGAAADLARAFIRRDAKLFAQTCVPAEFFRKSDAGKQYAAFVKSVSQGMAAEAKRKTPSPGGPKRIVTVYAVRPLSKDGPASYAYAVMNLKDVQFVDVAVELVNDKPAMNRTLVLQWPSGAWRVHPVPPLSPLLSDGLNDESASTKTIADVYTIRR